LSRSRSLALSIGVRELLSLGIIIHHVDRDPAPAQERVDIDLLRRGFLSLSLDLDQRRICKLTVSLHGEEIRETIGSIQTIEDIEAYIRSPYLGCPPIDP
jgi:hypothetical protein